jgi:phage-related protein
MSYDLGTAHGTIELEYNGHGAAARAEHDMDSVSKKGKKTESDLKQLQKAFTGLGKGILSIGKFSGIAIGLTQMGAAAANAAIQVAGMVPALTSLLSLSAALPGLFVAGAAAVGVLKASFAGVSDTLAAAFDPKKAKQFEEGLKKLSPAARDFAKAVQATGPTLKGLQQSIQETFFSNSGLAAGVPKIVAALSSIKGSLTGLAGDFGRTTKDIVGFAGSAKTIGFVRSAVDELRNAFGLVAPAIVPVLEGLRNVGGVGLPLMTQLGSAVSGVATNFADWLTAIAADGRLQSWIDTALTTLQTLGGIASNVGSILVSIFQAAGDTAGGLLNNIETLTGGFATFLKSAEGGEAIRSLFTGIGKVAAALSPVITTLVGALAGALGPALGDLATGVGPVLLKVVEALAPAFAPLATGFVDLLNAVAPILTPVATLVGLLAKLVGGALSTIAAELGPVIELFAGAFTDALNTLAPVLDQMVTQGLPLAAQAGADLLAAFAPLAPILVTLAQALADAFVANMPQILSVIEQLVPQIAAFAAALSGTLGTALTNLIPLIPTLVGAFVTFITVFYQIQGALLGLYTGFLNFLNFLTTIPGIVGSALSTLGSIISSIFGSVVSFVTSAVSSIVSFFAALPGRVGSVLAALPGVVLGIIKTMASQAAFAFGAAIGVLVSFALNAPKRIGSALAALPGQIRNIAVAAWNAGRAAFSAGISAVVGFAKTLPGRVRGAISSLGSTISSVAKSAWNAVKSAFSSGIGAVVGLARSLPGKVVSAVSGLGGRLAAAGRDAVAGFANGIRSGIQAVGAAARDLASSVMAGVRSTLKINSPSKEMMKIGKDGVVGGLTKGMRSGIKDAQNTAKALARYVLQGYTAGINGSAAQIKAANQKLANMVNDAYAKNSKGIRAISAAQKNNVLKVIARGNVQLLRLSAQATAVSARLKTAQANLADVQKKYNDTYASAVAKTKDTFNIVNPDQPISLELSQVNLKKAVAQAQAFAKNIQTLAKKGLNKDMIQQLVDAGATDGGAMAKALAGASSATIKQFNTLQGQLNGAANSVGRTTADALYGAGVKAAAGLVKGLQQQEKAIQKQMDRIALGMVNAIKKALKIKSPSRIMFNLGKFTSQGLLDGLNSLRSKVSEAAEKLATSSIIPTVKLSAQTSAIQTSAATRPSGPTTPDGGTFGPYNMLIDGKVIASLTIDAITGNPKTVAKAANEGNRVGSWTGSGRTNSGSR